MNKVVLSIFISLLFPSAVFAGYNSTSGRLTFNEYSMIVPGKWDSQEEANEIVLTNEEAIIRVKEDFTKAPEGYRKLSVEDMTVGNISGTYGKYKNDAERYEYFETASLFLSLSVNTASAGKYIKCFRNIVDSIAVNETNKLSKDIVLSDNEKGKTNKINNSDVATDILQVTIKDSEWSINDSFPSRTEYKKTIKVSPDLPMLISKNKRDLIMTEEGALEINETIWVNDGKNINYRHNRYDVTLDSAFIFDTENVPFKEMKMLLSELYEAGVFERYNYVIGGCRDSKGRNGVLLIDKYVKGTKIGSFYSGLFNGEAKFCENVGRVEDSISLSDVQFEIRGVLFFSHELDNHSFSLDTYSYEIEEGYSGNTCYGEKKVSGENQETGMLLVKINEDDGEYPSEYYELICIFEGEGTIYTKDSGIDSSNEEFYTFEIIDFIPESARVGYYTKIPS